jgi:hypothetical protein
MAARKATATTRPAPRKKAATEDSEEERSMPSITLSIRLGPMVQFQVEGRSCAEIAEALEGFERLNKTVDAMFSDLAERVYPEGALKGEGREE